MENYECLTMICKMLYSFSNFQRMYHHCKTAMKGCKYQPTCDIDDEVLKSDPLFCGGWDDAVTSLLRISTFLESFAHVCFKPHLASGLLSFMMFACPALVPSSVSASHLFATSLPEPCPFSAGLAAFSNVTPFCAAIASK